MILLPDVSDEDHQDCWQLARDYALRFSEKALKGRTIEEAAEDTYRGLLCERSYFKYVGEDHYEECVAGQEVSHSHYGSDAGDVDVKSTDMKYGPKYDYTLSVPFQNLKRDKETKKYVFIIRQDSPTLGLRFHYAGWATKEELLMSENELFYGKPNLKISQLHKPDA